MYEVLVNYCSYIETNLFNGTPAQNAFSRSVLLDDPLLFDEAPDLNLSEYEKNVISLVSHFLCNKKIPRRQISKLNVADKKRLSDLMQAADNLNIRALLPLTGKVQTIREFANKKTNGIDVSNIFVHDPGKSIEELNDEADEFYGIDHCDLFVIQMLEWHYFPKPTFNKNRRDRAPVIAQTSDFDIHIELIKDRLDNIDILTTLDGSEREKLEHLAENIFENPFAFGEVNKRKPYLHPDEKKYDVLISGQSYHYLDNRRNRLIDKIKRELKVKVHGYLSDTEYEDRLLKTRAVFCFARNRRTVLTRVFDALQHGCVPIIPEDNIFTHLLPVGTFLTFSDTKIPTSDEIDMCYRTFWQLRKKIPVFDLITQGIKYFRLMLILKVLWQQKLINSVSKKYQTYHNDNVLHCTSAHRAWLPDFELRIKLLKQEQQHLEKLCHNSIKSDEFLYYENLSFRVFCNSQLAKQIQNYPADQSDYQIYRNFYYLANSSLDLMTNVNCVRAFCVSPYTDLQELSIEIADNLIFKTDKFLTNKEIPALPYDYWGPLFNYEAYSDYIYSNPSNHNKLLDICRDTAIIVKILLEGTSEFTSMIKYDSFMSDILKNFFAGKIDHETIVSKKYFNNSFPFQHRFKPLFWCLEK